GLRRRRFQQVRGPVLEFRREDVEDIHPHQLLAVITGDLLSGLIDGSENTCGVVREDDIASSCAKETSSTWIFLSPRNSIRASLFSPMATFYAPAARVLKALLRLTVKTGWQGWPSHRVLVASRE